MKFGTKLANKFISKGGDQELYSDYDFQTTMGFAAGVGPLINGIKSSLADPNALSHAVNSTINYFKDLPSAVHIPGLNTPTSQSTTTTTTPTNPKAQNGWTVNSEGTLVHIGDPSNAGTISSKTKNVVAPLASDNTKTVASNVNSNSPIVNAGAGKGKSTSNNTSSSPTSSNTTSTTPTQIINTGLTNTNMPSDAQLEKMYPMYAKPLRPAVHYLLTHPDLISPYERANGPSGYSPEDFFKDPINFLDHLSSIFGLEVFPNSDKEKWLSNGNPYKKLGSDNYRVSFNTQHQISYIYFRHVYGDSKFFNGYDLEIKPSELLPSLGYLQKQSGYAVPIDTFKSNSNFLQIPKEMQAQMGNGHNAILPPNLALTPLPATPGIMPPLDKTNDAKLKQYDINENSLKDPGSGTVDHQPIGSTKFVRDVPAEESGKGQIYSIINQNLIYSKAGGFKVGTGSSYQLKVNQHFIPPSTFEVTLPPSLSDPDGPPNNGLAYVGAFINIDPYEQSETNSTPTHTEWGR